MSKEKILTRGNAAGKSTATILQILDIITNGGKVRYFCRRGVFDISAEQLSSAGSAVVEENHVKCYQDDPFVNRQSSTLESFRRLYLGKWVDDDKERT